MTNIEKRRLMILVKNYAFIYSELEAEGVIEPEESEVLENEEERIIAFVKSIAK